MAKGKKRKFLSDDNQANSGPIAKETQIDHAGSLPDGVHHYQTVEEVPWDIQKYWHQGYSIFSKYDAGIWMTDDAWFGVTHESVANKIATHLSKSAPANRSVIVDAFAGVGGNTIAFALSGKWRRVYAIEKDLATLQCAKHNAEIYGVADRITWFHGDCFEILGVAGDDGGDAASKNEDAAANANAVSALKAVIAQFGVIFASPPWGGPSYRASTIFDLQTMEPYTLHQIYTRFRKVTPHIVLYLPRTSDLRQIASYAAGNGDEAAADGEGKGKKVQIVHYCTTGSSRALCAYFGSWDQIVEGYDDGKG